MVLYWRDSPAMQSLGSVSRRDVIRCVINYSVFPVADFFLGRLGLTVTRSHWITEFLLFRHVLLEISLTEKVSEISSIASTFIAALYVEVTDNDTFNLLVAARSRIRLNSSMNSRNDVDFRPE